MEALAAKLWRDQRTSWSADDLEQWLLEFLDSRRDLQLHYRERVPDLWKEDLRTATFLVRRSGDEFSFAHTSLLEYFLATCAGHCCAAPTTSTPSRSSGRCPARAGRRWTSSGRR